MMVVRPLILALAVVFASIPAMPALGNDTCRLCEAKPDGETVAKEREIPVTIDITTRLSFSRTALTGNGQGGQISISPQNGSAQVQGGLVDLGGYALAGTAIVRGEPGRTVRIDMPRSIRMTSSTGGSIELGNLQTDLTPAPRLDATGVLNFSFGGALQVNGSVSGKFRGRIPITVQYE